MANPTPFGAFLQARRHLAGLSARAVAKELGLSHVAYGNVERGKPAILAEQYWPDLMRLYPDVSRADLERLVEESETTIEVDVSPLSADARPYAQEIARSLNRLDPKDLHRLLAVLEGSNGRIGPADFGDERVPRVPPMSKQDLVELADELLRLLQPSALEEPMPVNVVELVRQGGPVEQTLGLSVLPAHPKELQGEGAAFSEYILIRQDQWDELHNHGPGEFRARATVAHELGHAILHSTYLEQTETVRRGALVPRSQLKAYEDPEWQAWTLAQAFLIPIRTARLLPDRSAEALSDKFQVSLPFAEGYIRRFRPWLET